MQILFMYDKKKKKLQWKRFHQIIIIHGELQDETAFTNKVNVIIGIVQVVGTIVSVLALIILGIKFMIGSAEEKADYKQWMIYYVIGAILVFAISNISAIIYNTVKG